MAKSTGRTRLASLIGVSLFAGMVAAGATMPSTAFAADQLFLRLPGIRGESTDSAHKDEIVLHSYSQSFTNPGVPGGGGVNCGAVTVTKLIDLSSPALIGAVLSGRRFQTALITFRKAGEQPLDYYKVTLTDVLIHAITQTDASATDSTTVLEQISMSAVRFQFEYRPQRADGTLGGAVRFGWDCARDQRF